MMFVFILLVIDCKPYSHLIKIVNKVWNLYLIFKGKKVYSNISKLGFEIFNYSFFDSIILIQNKYHIVNLKFLDFIIE